jgi:dolichol-phosphate mannosyltransferase
MGASYGGVYLLTSILGISSVIIKIIVDTVLWLISFRIQHSWVFKNSIKR